MQLIHRRDRAQRNISFNNIESPFFAVAKVRRALYGSLGERINGLDVRSYGRILSPKEILDAVEHGEILLVSNEPFVPINDDPLGKYSHITDKGRTFGGPHKPPVREKPPLPSIKATVKQQLHEPGFYVVPKSTTVDQLKATLFPSQNLPLMSKFNSLNPNLGDIKAGSMIVLSDPNNTSCTFQEAQLMQAAQQVEASLDPLTPDEADFLQRHGAEIASFVGHGSTWLGVSAVMMESHLTSLRNTLQAIERLHQESYRQHGHLKSPQFFADRQRLIAKLDAHLLNSTRLRGQTTLGDHPKLKTALGISSRSLVHHWDKAGAPGQIPGYATHVEATSRAAKYMKAGGYIGIGSGGVSSLLAIQQVCSDDSDAACEKVKFTEGGKFAGSTFIGAVGGGVASSAGSAVCVALGVSTGVGGVVCAAALVGAGAWVGTTYGGMGGEYLGEKIYETTQP